MESLLDLEEEERFIRWQELVIQNSYPQELEVVTALWTWQRNPGLAHQMRQRLSLYDSIPMVRDILKTAPKNTPNYEISLFPVKISPRRAPPWPVSMLRKR